MELPSLCHSFKHKFVYVQKFSHLLDKIVKISYHPNRNVKYLKKILPKVFNVHSKFLYFTSARSKPGCCVRAGRCENKTIICFTIAIKTDSVRSDCILSKLTGIFAYFFFHTHHRVGTYDRRENSIWRRKHSPFLIHLSAYSLCNARLVYVAYSICKCHIPGPLLCEWFPFITSYIRINRGNFRNTKQKKGIGYPFPG